MWKECNVVLLPTNKKAVDIDKIILCEGISYPLSLNNQLIGWIYAMLYKK
jgi:hypothetical protein